jgi:hypothetical protein
VQDARTILRGDTKPWETRCRQADKLLTALLDTGEGSFVSRVRQMLATDHARVKTLLAGIADLEFRGRPDDPDFVR